MHDTWTAVTFLSPFGMDGFGVLLPLRDCLLEFLEFVAKTCSSTVLIRLDELHCHDVIGLRQVLLIDIVVTQLIDVLRVVVIVLGVKLALNYHVRLELFDVGIDVLLHRSPLMTSRTMRFTGQKNLMISMGALEEII